MQEMKSSSSGLNSHLNQQSEYFDQRKVEISNLMSKITMQQEMLDQELKSVKETQKSKGK